MTNPTISLNKLAEYTQASATRRKQIIKTLKQDFDFKKFYYRDVKLVLPKFFKSNYDHAILHDAIESVKDRPITTKWTESDIKNSVEAINALKTANLPDLTNYKVIRNLFKVDEIQLGGMTVTLKPEIYLLNTKTNKLGAVKFHIAKTPANRLNSTAMEYAATLLRCGFLEYGADLSDIDIKACISIDVFAGTHETAPKAYVRSLGQLQDSCEEIFARWDSI